MSFYTLFQYKKGMEVKADDKYEISSIIWPQDETFFLLEIRIGSFSSTHITCFVLFDQ